MPDPKQPLLLLELNLPNSITLLRWCPLLRNFDTNDKIANQLLPSTHQVNWWKAFRKSKRQKNKVGIKEINSLS